jgi:hypothetical protein
MGSGSKKPKSPRAARREVELPKPSITLDVVMPIVGGGTEQRRPTFTDFYEAVDGLQALQREWDNKVLPAHKRAARKK